MGLLDETPLYRAQALLKANVDTGNGQSIQARVYRDYISLHETAVKLAQAHQQWEDSGWCAACDMHTHAEECSVRLILGLEEGS